MSESTPQPKKLVSLNDILSSKIPDVLIRPAEKFLGLEKLNKAYNLARLEAGEKFSQNFFSYAMSALGLNYTLTPEELELIPKEGPCIIVANHPHGLSDGIMFGDLLTRVRKDVKILANEQLSLCSELIPWLIQVDVYENSSAVSKNINAVREMLQHLKKGGLLGVFPAGSASTFSVKDMRIIDDPWNSNIASLVRKSNATVIPIHISGRSSLLFQGISLVKKSARVAFLPRELKRDSSQLHRITVGKPISSKILKEFESNDAMISYLRLRTYVLDPRYTKKRKKDDFNSSLEGKAKEPIAGPQAKDLLIEEIKALPPERILSQKGQWKVYYARAEEIPHLLLEIGRLREITFRSAGEGSGKSLDLDDFDPFYLHLFLWDEEKNQIVGAYRMGQTDEILQSHGQKGLYNCQFFHFDEDVLRRINPGLEMGRAFICEEYQRRPLSLSLIWQGIGAFLVHFPRYRYMFGTVSTSDLYCDLSRELIVQFLKHNAMDLELSKGVKAINPPANAPILSKTDSKAFADSQQDLSNFSTWISEIEDDGKGIPVLLRQYLKLNGKILAFNIDEEFGNVLDCLILVDFHEIPEKSLRKFLGPEAAEAIAKGIREVTHRA